MHYYVYHNWQAQKNAATIHKYNCGDCQSGNGKRAVKIVGKNGVWIGPFDNKDLAEKFILKIGINKIECSNVMSII